MNENDLNNILKISEYSEHLINGYNNIKLNKFDEALNEFQKSLNISKEINNDYMINESTSNIGICYFYLGDINKGVEKLEECFQSLENKISSSNNSNDAQFNNLYLLIKVLSNLCLGYFSLNKTSNSINIIQKIIEIIKKEKKIKNKMIFLQKVIFTIFRCNNLINLEEILNKNNYEMANENNEYYEIICSKLINQFNYYLISSKIENWIETLNETIKYLEEIKDYNSLLYITFILLESEFYKEAINIYESNNNENYELKDYNIIKNKLLDLIKSFNMNFDNEDNLINDEILPKNILEKIYNYFKEKIIQSYNIYENLLNIEKKYNLEINGIDNEINDNNIYNKIEDKLIEKNKKYFLNLVNNNSIQFLNENLNENEELKNNLISELNNNINLIENNIISEDLIDINQIKKICIKKLNILFYNIKHIFYLKILSKYFKIYKKKIKKIIKKNREKYFENYYEEFSTEGNKLIKVNYNSNGMIERFYQFNLKSKKLEIYKNFDDDIQIYGINDIKKFQTGIKSKNLLNKVKSLNNKYLFFSIITKDRSIDLIFDNIEIEKKWFYGFQKYLKNKNLIWKIPSTTNFILNKLKINIIKTLDIKIDKNINQKSFIKYFLKFWNVDLNTND